MMKSLVYLLTLLTSARAGGMDISVTSEVGQKMIRHATRDLADAKQGDDYYYDQYGNYKENWVSGYSIKFQGCHHISQWNEAAESEDDVRITTKRLVRFRLCPSGSCDSKSSSGCTSGYGDYILDMNTFLEYYFEAKETYQAFQCNYLSTYVCDCSYSNDEEKCLYYCFEENGMASVCMAGTNYNDDASKGENFNLETYMECTQSNYEDANGNPLYIGPYCSNQGGGILLGVFTDDLCTIAADANGGTATFYEASGFKLPYTSASIVDMDCVSCKEPANNNNDGNDASDTDDVAQVCEKVYELAGKCEQHMAYGTVGTPNNNACNYMEGIKIVRKDGTVVTADAKANKTASVFIGLFCVAFVLLAAYVYYLKTKLDRASINLSE